MLTAALDGGVPASWVCADSVYGCDYQFRQAIEGRKLGYVVEVRNDQRVWVDTRQVRVRERAAELPAESWQRASCGSGSKGPREYDWACCAMNGPEPEHYRRWLLVRRDIDNPEELAYYFCGGPPQTTVAELIRIAGRRWAVEECFELAKGECGLDEYEVRNWHGWYRHITLSMFALALLTVIRRAARSAESSRPKKGVVSSR